MVKQMTEKEYKANAIKKMDRTFGKGYAEENPQFVEMFMRVTALNYQPKVLKKKKMKKCSFVALTGSMDGGILISNIVRCEKIGKKSLALTASTGNHFFVKFEDKYDCFLLDYIIQNKIGTTHTLGYGCTKVYEYTKLK